MSCGWTRLDDDKRDPQHRYGSARKLRADRAQREPEPLPFDSWLGYAKERGLSVMSVGDPAWREMYAHFGLPRVDPQGVAIDVDFNPITFRDARELLRTNPDVLIVHFVTPDHQAHAHSVPSAAYANHIRGFDRDLFGFLKELGPEWTLVVAGDHGAADSGTHGADTDPAAQRGVRAGTRIVRGAKSPGPIDQADLAGTLATLLGLPLPVHSRGHLLVQWLDTSPSVRAKIACSDARRATDLAHSLGLADVAVKAGSLAGHCEQSPAALVAAKSAVALVDHEIEGQTGLGSAAVPPLIALLSLLGLATALLATGSVQKRAVLACVLVGVLGVGLTWGVERLPGTLPNTTRLLLFSAGNLPALLALLWPGRFGAFLEGHRAIAAALLPGFLLATYTTNAQPEAYVAVAVAALLFVLVGGLEPSRPTLLSAKRVLSWPHLGLMLGLIAVLYLSGTRTSELYPAWFRRDPRVVLGVAGALIWLAVGVLTGRSSQRRRYEVAAVAAVVIVAALFARRFIPPWPGRIAIVVALSAAGIAALRGQRLLALLAGLFAYTWISRDAEIIAIVATLLVADGVGAALARHRARDGRGADPLPLSQTLLVTAFLFGLVFVQRVGIQGALDFGAMDWGVAGFGDPHVPAWIVGSALGLKYALGLWLLLGAFLSSSGRRVERWYARRLPWRSSLARRCST
ncbi:MAG: alkaline phosphatase family protein [Polyangiaceae bacterium]